ncbi:hypothetical protein ScPMuIL_008620 [Solemya velum]
MENLLQLLVCMALITSALSHSVYLNNSDARMAVGLNAHGGHMYASKYMLKPKADIHNLNITMLRYRELDSDGAVIRTIDFTKSELGGNQYNITEEKDVPFGDGQKADVLTLQTYINETDALVEMKVRQLTGMGYVPLSGEDHWAYYGRVHYTHKISGWKFSDSPRKGERLELMFKLKARGYPNPIHHNTLSKNLCVFDLGNGGTYILAKKIHVDGDLQTFANGYPHLEGGGDLTIAFPRFSQSAAFDALYGPSSTYEVAPEPTVCPTDPPMTHNKMGSLDINVNVKS